MQNLCPWIAPQCLRCSVCDSERCVAEKGSIKYGSQTVVFNMSAPVCLGMHGEVLGDHLGINLSDF
jgi:hypothetical protein